MKERMRFSEKSKTNKNQSKTPKMVSKFGGDVAGDTPSNKAVIAIPHILLPIHIFKGFYKF